MEFSWEPSGTVTSPNLNIMAAANGQPPHLRIPNRTSSKAWNYPNRFTWLPSFEEMITSQTWANSPRPNSESAGFPLFDVTMFEPRRSFSAPSSRTSSPIRNHSRDRAARPPWNTMGKGTDPRRGSRNLYMGNSRRKSRALNSTKHEELRRWNGISKTACAWDGLRKDSELWFPQANCLIHLYEKGHSRRGPSFRIPLRVIQDAQCDSLFDMCVTQLANDPTATPPAENQQIYEIYIPAPEDSMRGEALLWHITTRNFFAFLFGRPLVGTLLGETIASLYERINLYRPENPDNEGDFLRYLERGGYLDFTNCPDHALAALVLAERYRMHQLYIDAFAHCVGMNHSLDISPELGNVSTASKNLIARSFLEMDIHLTRVQHAVRNFLEDELSSSYLAFSDGALNHLNRFRSFLQNFYVNKFGYWPPPDNKVLPKALYRSLYFDFAYLHDYLADFKLTNKMLAEQTPTESICVLQNVRAFNEWNKYPPLPHPHPLMPDLHDGLSRNQSHRALHSLGLRTKPARSARVRLVRDALRRATNSGDPNVVHAPLVRAYAAFEYETCELLGVEDISASDARKVRWIVVYAMLQILVSALRAPREVRNPEAPTYPLCCPLDGFPPWEANKRASLLVPESLQVSSEDLPMSETPPLKEEFAVQPPSPVPSVHPGSQVNHLELERRCKTSHGTQDVDVPAPLRIKRNATTGHHRPSTAPSARSILRSSSVRSIRNLSPFSPRRASAMAPKPVRQSFCEIIVDGYGNGLNPSLAPESSDVVPTAPQSHNPVLDPASVLETPTINLDAESPTTPTDQPKRTLPKSRPLILQPYPGSPWADAPLKPRTPIFGTHELEGFLINQSVTVMGVDPELPKSSHSGSVGSADTAVGSGAGMSRSGSTDSVGSTAYPPAANAGDWRGRSINRMQHVRSLIAKHRSAGVRRSVSVGDGARSGRARSIDIFEAVERGHKAMGPAAKRFTFIAA